MIAFDASIAVLIIFSTFCIGTLFAVYYTNTEWVRKGYLSIFFVSILMINVIGAPIMPFVHLQKFSEPPDQSTSYHEIRMVDSTGKEIKFDGRATGHLAEPELQDLAKRMATQYSDRQKNETGLYLLHQSQEYRTEVESGTNIWNAIQFPRHIRDYEWSQQELGNYGNFTALRIYEIQIGSASDGRESWVENETMVVEVQEGE